MVESRLFLAGFVVYTMAFLLTTSRGTVSQASVIGTTLPLSASRVSPVPESPPQKAPRSSWDRNVYALPSRGNFKRFYRMTATAYRPTHRGIERGRWTATQRDGRSAHGVAVDQAIIPPGSRLWIPGYGHAVADDTGG